MKNDNRLPMQKAAFALSMISLNLVFIVRALSSLFDVSPFIVMAAVLSIWIVFAGFYGIQVWRQSKRESQAIEDKYETKMKQLIAESSAAIKSQ
jgi:predicted membrane protein